VTDKWNDEAENILKSILKRKDIGYDELADLLSQIGVKETSGSINSKINRGTFKFVFFMQCMKVLGIHKIDLD
jgi:hypothetical protein